MDSARVIIAVHWEDDHCCHVGSHQCCADLNVVKLEDTKAPSSCFKDRLRWAVEKLSRDEVTDILTRAWAAWTCRNEIIFNNAIPKAELVAHKFLKMVSDYKSYAERVFSGKPSSSASSLNEWQPPPMGVYKINTDAAVFDNGLVGLGVVLRDHMGKLLAIGTKRLNVRWSPELAELAAIRFGLQSARKLLFYNVHLECDALAVAQKLWKFSFNLSPSSLLLEDIAMLCQSFSTISFSHVKRVGNVVAHYVARLSPIVGDELLYLNNFPQGVIALAGLDFTVE